MAFKDWPPILQLYVKVNLVVTLLTFLHPTVHSFVTLFGICWAIPILSWQITRLIRRRILPRKRIIVNPRKSVLVTGCDSGFGHQIAHRLDSLGFTVFAGCLFSEGEGAQKLISISSSRLKILKLDVTSESDVREAVDTIKSSNTNLWAVVNNAGIANYQPAEFGEGVEDMERTFAVNVTGVVRVTKECLPLIRHSKGRIVNIASMMGRYSFSGLSYYCMSKFAVRAFSDSLRREMYSFGVKVITIEPMMYSTNIMNVDNIMSSIDKVWMRTKEETKQAYGSDFLERFKRRALVSLKTCRPQIYEVVDSVIEGIALDDPDLYYRCCGPGERPALWVSEFLPEVGLDVMLTGHIWGKMLRIFGSK